MKFNIFTSTDMSLLISAEEGPHAVEALLKVFASGSEKLYRQDKTGRQVLLEPGTFESNHLVDGDILYLHGPEPEPVERKEKSKSKTVIIAGRSNKALAAKISERTGFPLLPVDYTTFANDEILIKLKDSVRGHRVYVIETGSSTGCEADRISINDHLMALLFAGSACKRADAAAIGAICPTFPYARSDKKDSIRSSISSADVAQLIETMGYSRIVTCDIHAGQTQGTVPIPFDNLYASNTFIAHFRETLFKDLSPEEISAKYILVSPDAGGAKRIKEYANKLRMPHCLMDKSRDYSQVNVVSRSVLIGPKDGLGGRIGIVIDDMIDTMGTMVAGVADLMSHGAGGAIVVATHGILSGPALERINRCDDICKVIVTDTIDQSANQRRCPKLEVVSIAPLLSEVLLRIENGGSISELFL